MHILLFAIYTVALCWALTKVPFFKDIRPVILIGFFLLRVAAGCVHNWVAWRYFPHHGDIWLFFEDSLRSRHLLFTDPHRFWEENYALSYLPHNLIEWVHILFNYLSFDNFYINTLFFCFITCGGFIALFRTFYERFNKDTLSATAMLLLPSVLFWTSCMHTEGVIFPVLGWLFYAMHRSLKKGWKTRRMITTVLLIALAILFRPALAVGLIPALAIWTLSEIGARRKRWLLGIGLLVVLSAGIAFIYPRAFIIIPRLMSDRQHEFQALSGGSRIYLPVLDPTWKSVQRVLPDALLNGLVEPLFSFNGQKVYKIFSLELFAVWATAAVAVGIPRNKFTIRPFSIACAVLAILGMVLIGYIIPFLGAIVRYRSIYLPFILGPALASFRSFVFIKNLNTRLSGYIFKQNSPQTTVS